MSVKVVGFVCGWEGQFAKYSFPQTFGENPVLLGPFLQKGSETGVSEAFKIVMRGYAVLDACDSHFLFLLFIFR